MRKHIFVIPAKETVDFLHVGVAAALVAAVRDAPERGQAPRLQRRGDGTHFALVRSSCRHRLSTVSKAGIHGRTFGPAPPLDARVRGHDDSLFAKHYSMDF
jgi:hypothetical protein